MKLSKFFFENWFSGGPPCQERPKNSQNKSFGAIFCNFAHILKSAKQHTVQLEVFHQDLNLITGFEIFLAIQGVIFPKNAQNWSAIAYLMEYSIA